MALRSLPNLDYRASISNFVAKPDSMNTSIYIQYIQTEPRLLCKSLAEQGTELLSVRSVLQPGLSIPPSEDTLFLQQKFISTTITQR